MSPVKYPGRFFATWLNVSVSVSSGVYSAMAYVRAFATHSFLAANSSDTCSVWTVGGTLSAGIMHPDSSSLKVWYLPSPYTNPDTKSGGVRR